MYNILPTGLKLSDNFPDPTKPVRVKIGNEQVDLDSQTSIQSLIKQALESIPENQKPEFFYAFSNSFPMLRKYVLDRERESPRAEYPSIVNFQGYTGEKKGGLIHLTYHDTLVTHFAVNGSTVTMANLAVEAVNGFNDFENETHFPTDVAEYGIYLRVSGEMPTDHCFACKILQSKREDMEPEERERLDQMLADPQNQEKHQHRFLHSARLARNPFEDPSARQTVKQIHKRVADTLQNRAAIMTESEFEKLVQESM